MNAFTKAEAVHKVCPSITYPIDTHSGAHASCSCCADECMAWRWLQSRRIKEGAPGYSKEHYEEIPIEERQGYCGLAGKP